MDRQNYSDFRRGEFKWYRATTSFHVGEQEGLKIGAGDYVEYDGTTLRVGREEHPARNVRGAIIKKWLVPENDVTTTYVPQAAGIVISPAEIGSTESQEANTRPLQATAAVREPENKVVRTSARPQETSAAVGQVSTVENYGVPVTVGRINVPTRFNSELSTSTSGSALADEVMKVASQAEKVSIIGHAGSDLSDILPGVTSSGDGQDPEKQARIREAAQRAEAARQQRMAMVEADMVSRMGPGAIEVNRDSDISGVELNTPPRASGSAPVTVHTSAGVDWDMSAEPIVRIMTATSRYGNDRESLSSIADVESPEVAVHLRKFIAANF